MKRIDFMGVPGSGKTTVYNELLKKMGSSGLLLGKEKAKKLAIYNMLIKEGKKGNMTKSFTKAQLTRFPIIKYSKGIFASRQNALYLRFACENESFIRAAMIGLFSREHITQNFIRTPLSAKWFIQIIAELRLIEEFLMKEIAVCFDESLCHKIYEVINFDYHPITPLQLEQVDSIFRNMPLPYAVIYFEEDSAEVENRLAGKKRLRQKDLKRNNRSLESWVRDAFQLAEAGMKVLSERNVKILVVPAGMSAIEKVALIKQFIDR